MGNLTVDIGATTEGLDVGLGKAERLLDKFTSKAGKKLQKAFGIGFLASQGVGLIHKVFGRAEEIEKFSKQFSLTTDEVQLLEAAAKEAGVTFEEYMAKAKDGAVNLEKVLDRMRKKGTVELISAQDVETLSKDMGRIDKVGSGLKRRAAGLFGAILGMPEALGSGNFGDFLLQGIRAVSNVIPAGQLVNQWAVNRLTPAKENKMGQVAGWTPLINPLDVMRVVLGQRLQSAEDRKDMLERSNRHGSFWSGEKTDWQQAGAFSSRPSIILEDTNVLLDSINDEIKDIRKQIEFLKNGAP